MNFRFGCLTTGRSRWARSSLRIFVLVTFALLHAVPTFAQESSSRPDDDSAQPANRTGAPDASRSANAGLPRSSDISSGPASALRDALMAACSQNAADFSRFLTARSRRSFNGLTPAARVALMKRFVLLNVPGKATSSENAGGPLVRCETVDVTTEMAVGGADIRDNLAFLPMELRDAADNTGSSVHRINIGMVREDGQWRLLSLGLLLLDLPALEVEWDAAEAAGNEVTALEVLKKLGAAVETYRRTYMSLPQSLAKLGPPTTGAANREAAGLVDSELASSVKDGYNFRIVISGASSLGAPAKYELAATPTIYGRTGKRSFFRDADGGWHTADHRGAVGSASDTKIN